ncbi:hypothetical protein NDU88_006890 [Pleurodeles waltl]|uniref:Uncharacterized protein n=1 Tax=Pleurodeles waltl TaxID=8319 RepID=A0AAV7QQ94_PLEWA|nr:hypothetical protein NDU88_006890 [Pleurodeles waltl]
MGGRCFVGVTVWVCDGLTLPRSDPPYLWGTGTVEFPDPDILRLATNQEGLLGDGRQKQALRTVTGEAKRRKELGGVTVEEGGEELGGVNRRESRNNLSGVLAVESGEAIHSVQGKESEEDTWTTSGATRCSGGPGGRTPELRPRSGESVALAVFDDIQSCSGNRYASVLLSVSLFFQGSREAHGRKHKIKHCKEDAPGMATLLLKRGWEVHRAPPAPLAPPWTPPGRYPIDPQLRLTPARSVVVPRFLR